MGKPMVLPAFQVVPLDETNLTCAIKLSGRSFINAANDTWSGNPKSITRYNSRYVVDLPGWTLDAITFNATALDDGVHDDGVLAVLVNGSLFASPYATQDNLPHDVTVSGMGTAAKHVEIWSGWPERTALYDQGIDGPQATVYINSVQVPTGQAAPQRKTASRGIIIIGDSLDDGSATAPSQYNGWGGQLRSAAHAAGQLLGHLAIGASTFRGSGPTADDQAQMISDLADKMGLTDCTIVSVPRTNDWFYTSLPSSVQTTDTQYGTHWAAMVDGVTSRKPRFAWLVTAPFIPTTNASLNSIGIARSAYWTAIQNVAATRSQMTIVDATTWGLILPPASPNDYADAGVHLGTNGAVGNSGHNKAFAALRVPLGI